ncbi:MAG: hypothetical protein AB7P21_18820 [Lautropia sp.]
MKKIDSRALRNVFPSGAGFAASSCALALLLAPGATLRAQSPAVTTTPAFMTAGQQPAGAQAAGSAEIYAVAGFPGVGLGAGFGINDRLGLRAQYTTLGNPTRDVSESGIDYKGKLRSDMLGVYLDGFVSGGFRVTGGVSFNDLKVRGTGVPASAGSVTINGTTIAYGAGDSISLEATTPNVAPYLGIGYGHAPGSRGWSFSIDAGVHFSKFTAKLDASQGVRDRLTAAGRDAQAEIDAEQAKVQKEFDKLPVWPMLLIGIGYRF